MKASLTPLFHQVLRQLKKCKLEQKKLLIAVSGGVDSITLMDLMNECSRVLKFKISVAHVHHGLNKNSYRDEVQMFVHSFCEGMNIPFYTNKPTKHTASSEAQLRKIRYKYLSQWLKKYDYLVLAHTTNDLLETRLIRLIRGTGKQGLTSMQLMKDKQLRPLIDSTKKDIIQYAKSRKLEWMEDPSNKDTDTIRNWIRKYWLPKLENKRTGSIQNLSRSLERLSENIPISLDSQGFSRKEFLKLSLNEQKQKLAIYMKLNNISNYTHRHIEELIKYIKSKRKNIQFSMLKKQWVITSYLVRVEE